MRYLGSIIIIGLLLFSGLTCNERSTEFVGGTTDYGNYDPIQNPSGYFSAAIEPSGGPFSRPTGMAVIDNDSPEARILCEFNTQIDNSSLTDAFTLMSTGGENIPLEFYLSIGAVSSLTLWPGTDLEYNTTYILTLIAGNLLDVAGNNLDIDGDLVGGETPDDNIVLRFTTFNADSTAGSPVPNTSDDISPSILGNLYFLIADTIVAFRWMDVSLAVNISDYARDTLGNSYQLPLSPSEFDPLTVILRDSYTKTMVGGTIAYDDDSTSSTYLRLSYDPSSILAAGTDYELVLKAESIADAAGNKLDNTSDIIFNFTTIDRTSDSSIIVDDVIPPSVLSFSNNGPSFTIFFTEEIDVSTINPATISVSINNSPNDGSLLVELFARPQSPTGYATQVTFYPNDPNQTGDMVIVRGMIADWTGNIKGDIDIYYW
ncbi:MAG: Ig-like domain-containing protein [Candidatus Zixiibacteriota bacterium]|nr:MAG: Ig-like domain-containing protein [candidate division Zixibacteria bacterium]